MKIDDAIAQYRGICNISDTPPFYQITSQLIENGYDSSFENDSYFDALCLTHVMLCRTFVGASILTGSGASKFWEALRNPLEDCLARLKIVKGKIRMVTLDAKDDLSYLKSLKSKFPETFEMVNASSASRLGHFIVCDGRMVRLEETHPPLDSEIADDSMVKAKVNFNDALGASHCDKFFNNIWDRLVTSPKKSP